MDYLARDGLAECDGASGLSSSGSLSERDLSREDGSLGGGNACDRHCSRAFRICKNAEIRSPYPFLFLRRDEWRTPVGSLLNRGPRLTASSWPRLWSRGGVVWRGTFGLWAYWWERAWNTLSWRGGTCVPFGIGKAPIPAFETDEVKWFCINSEITRVFFLILSFTYHEQESSRRRFVSSELINKNYRFHYISC